MFKGLIGKKVGMTQIFDQDGNAVPITLIEAGPCFVTQIRQTKHDGYSAVQLGFGAVNERKISGGEKGHLKKNEIPSVKYLREFNAKTIDVKEGDVVDVSQFAVGNHVDVVGYSKGRGFAGAVKRYGFRGGPKTHGQSDRVRAPGSHGSGTTPGRVYKGSRGPGHMGNERVTSQHVEVVYVDVEKNLLGINGSVPGPKGGLVVIKEARKQ
ncbi:MAG TPA: 50S ribosomal protein L3 [Anaerolineaceae bacterium]|uniref:Large ribosomal subunit protein uL3 n=1 Tax=Anaerolinea thermophila TaxID=167964 RepID=A0A101FYV7_9CHLR|nr:MAG: 50S ribosomal protein L3 [Anaerolinea thermophila]HAF62915.1 50S ribosomal protein L3 [Anaerolineaceae bacterium]